MCSRRNGTGEGPSLSFGCFPPQIIILPLLLIHLSVSWAMNRQHIITILVFNLGALSLTWRLNDYKGTLAVMCTYRYRHWTTVYIPAFFSDGAEPVYAVTGDQECSVHGLLNPFQGKCLSTSGWQSCPLKEPYKNQLWEMIHVLKEDSPDHVMAAMKELHYRRGVIVLATPLNRALVCINKNSEIINSFGAFPLLLSLGISCYKTIM